MDKRQAGPHPSVIRDLEQHPHRYPFSQAVELLRLWKNPRTAKDLNAFLRHRLRFRPDLSLDHAHSDITKLEFREDGKIQITAAFLGLYGASSPLPTFYTQRLLDEQADGRSAMRDFLDIFNNQFFLMHALISSHLYPLHIRTKPPTYDTSTGRGRMLAALAVFGDELFRSRLPDERYFLRYAGFFFQQTRSAPGLRAILADALANAGRCDKTRIHCNAPRLARIPEDQRLSLGLSATVLGEEATLGDVVPCYEGKIIVELDGLDENTLRELLPGRHLAQVLHSLLRNYCRVPLEYAVKIKLLPGQVQAACPGGVPGGDGDATDRFARLGWDTWLGFGGSDPAATLPEVTVDFPAGFAPGAA
jgi:type VI secretion system protein ImpH